jgi:hypothetical protein
MILEETIKRTLAAQVEVDSKLLEISCFDGTVSSLQ